MFAFTKQAAKLAVMRTEARCQSSLNNDTIASAWVGSYLIRDPDIYNSWFPRPRRRPQFNEIILTPQMEPDEEKRPAAYHQYRSNLKNSPEKMWHIDRFIRGMPIDEAIKQSSFIENKEEEEALRSSSRVVWGAVIINCANFVAKSGAWFYTGSHSLFAEAIHSLADTANQLILAVGIRKSLQSPTPDHPYGYHPMRYIAPLISGVGIFCVGCGLSVYHGIEGLLKPDLICSPSWAYAILAFSLVSESATLFMAVRALNLGAKNSKISMKDYIARNRDPGVIVVLLEDVAAVLGIGIAASCMALTSYYGSHVFDAAGSLLIGSLLGGVATFIIKKNTVALVGRSIPSDTLNAINQIIEKDVIIRAIHDVKATDLGNGVIRYKAEVDVDGRELSKRYIEKIDKAALLEEIRLIKDEKDATKFVIKHGENVVDTLGAEVDRIEKELRRTHPRVKHVDLEVL